ncbi:unnamed protein product [Leuciscus chuanchicus]
MRTSALETEPQTLSVMASSAESISAVEDQDGAASVKLVQSHYLRCPSPRFTHTPTLNIPPNTVKY